MLPQTSWIVSPRYDLAWFFGGALMSVAVLGLYFGVGVPIVVLFWIWLLAFDGPHIGAAFTRTYLDRREWTKRPGVLWKSLLCFAIGPAFLLLNLVTGSQTPFLLFLGFAALYGYYHVVRQHYGFLAIYKARNRHDNPIYRPIDKWFLYAGCWLPYIYFVFTHPKARRLLWFLGEEVTPREQWIAYLILLLWVLGFVVFLATAASDVRARIRQPHVLYAFLTVVLYGGVYFFVAHYEPVYAQSQGPDQDFLLISILVTIFHNIQYVGLVWFYDRNRYSIDNGSGVVGGVTRSFARYMGTLVFFSGVVYLLFASATGVFPALQLFRGASLGPFTVGQIGLCLWWGLAINHYYLDQKIWRVRNDDELKRNLKLA